MPNFREFDYKGTSKNDKRPAVSLQTRGSFMFNRAAYEMLGKPQAVKLLFDEDERIVGFRPAEPDEPRAYRLHKANNAESYNIAAKSFANYFEIDISETRRYGVKMYDDIVAIHLDEPDTKSGRTRGK